MSRPLIAGHAGFYLKYNPHWNQDVCEVDKLAHRSHQKDGSSAVGGKIIKATLGYPSGKELANSCSEQTGRTARRTNRGIGRFGICYRIFHSSIIPEDPSLDGGML